LLRWTIYPVFAGTAKLKPVNKTAAFLVTLAWGVCAACPEAALARFTVCNQTLQILNLAMGIERDGRFQTEGWWIVSANSCIDLVKTPLENRFVYVYAMNVRGEDVFKGKTRMCVNSQQFVIDGVEECWQRGYDAANFAEIDTGDALQWDLFLRDSGE